MRMLVDRSRDGTDLPFDLGSVKLHLRVDGTEEDAAITNIGHAACAEIEHFAQIALLTQTITVTIVRPVLEGCLRLPIGPLIDVTSVAIRFDGTAFDAFSVVGGIRPLVHWEPHLAPPAPAEMVVIYEAGFGTDTADIPPDLAQALMDQAALHYDGRSPMDAKSLTTSPHMARIGARYRGVQV